MPEHIFRSDIFLFSLPQTVRIAVPFGLFSFVSTTNCPYLSSIQTVFSCPHLNLSLSLFLSDSFFLASTQSVLISLPFRQFFLGLNSICPYLSSFQTVFSCLQLNLSLSLFLSDSFFLPPPHSVLLSLQFRQFFLVSTSTCPTTSF